MPIIAIKGKNTQVGRPKKDVIFLTVSLSKRHISIAKRLGDGVSKGIREAFKRYRLDPREEKKYLSFLIDGNLSDQRRIGISITNADSNTARSLGFGTKARGIRTVLELFQTDS